MSFIQLHSGKFLVIDTIELNDKLRQEINHLTDNGDKIEAVIGTHPFHTLSFPAFYESYPNAAYYGTPRHLRRLTHIPWIGNLHDCDVRKKWEPDVELRFPAGAEFINPQPESSNHFSSVFVYHRASATLHVDDTIIYAEKSNFLLKLFGYKDGGAHRDVFTLLVKAERLFGKLSERNRKRNPEGELPTGNHHTMNILEDECG
ncbi:unnamed protein product [Rotaria magnacalcarata]|uniref:Uncharacterized protein n=1 Tax=Rotaria magnacalcarata TaxID=392030 RepID=A0A8S2W0C1_9BILA|nr:unnamed protein product [Rotaria magnacalcarata]